MSNGNDIFYPTASTSVVFLNGLHVEEAYRIDIKESAPKTPVYGYNDIFYAKTVAGKSLIQGLLIVNFTVPFYLNYVLDSVVDSFVPTLYNYDITKRSGSTEDQLRARVSRQLATELPANSTDESRAARAEYISSLLSKQNKYSKEAVKRAIYDFFDPTANAEARLDREAILKSQPKTLSSPLHISSKSDGGNTLDVYYNDPSDTSWFNRFHKVEFFDVSQQINQAGAEGSAEPLYEIYSFIAQKREIRLLR